MDVLGESQRRNKNEWFDQECGNVILLRNQLRKEWLQDGDDEKKRRYSQALKLVKKTNRRRKREALDKLLLEMENDRREHKAREQFQKIN